MSARSAKKPPNPPSISLSSLLAPVLALILGIVLAKHHSGHLHHLTRPVLSVLPQCPPTNICPFFYLRSTLPSGRCSTRLFDVPRRHLHSNYSALPSLSPGTVLVHQWRHPRVLVFDGGFDPLVQLLINKTQSLFLPTTVVDDHDNPVVDNNRRSDTAFISPHRDDHPFNQFVDRLIRLVGLPNRQYSEIIQVNRYNQTGFFAIHYDFLSHSTLMANSPFQGCQRVATAVLQLTDVQGGETVFVRDPHFKGGFDDIDPNSDDVLIVPTKKGRLVAWFNLHPDTEDIDHATWHGSMPVTDGQKIAATFYLRNCSQADNSRRRAQYEAFMKNRPSPSVGVAEKQTSLLGLDDLDGDDFDDIDDDDDDDGGQKFDPKEDEDYLEDLRKYRELRDAEGNSTDALIKAGYLPEDFEELDKEVQFLDELDEDEEEKKETERLRLYKKIKDGGGTVQNFKDAGFMEDELKFLDEEVELYAKEFATDKAESVEESEQGREQDNNNDEREGDDESVSDYTDQSDEGTAGDHATEDEENLEERDHLYAERELGMDEESIREFERKLLEDMRAGEKEIDDVLDDGDDDDGLFDDDDEEDEDGGGQCGGDDDFDFKDDEEDIAWDDDDEEWEMEGSNLMGERFGTGGKVIPPGSVAQGVGVR